MKYLLLTLALVACSPKGKHEEIDAPIDDGYKALGAKFVEVFDDTATKLDPATGWPSPSDCDGLLWAGKAAAVGLPTNVDLAEYSSGELHRRPPPSCWNSTEGDVGSKSTISNDMILGWLWAKWSARDYEAIKRLADYGEAHNWKMGEPSSQVGRVFLKTNQIGLVGRMLYVLSEGRNDRTYRHFFEAYQPAAVDYERHIQALGILLQGEVRREKSLTSINDQMLDRLHDLVDAEPTNPLFQAALARYTGSYDTAITLLLAEDTPVPSYVRGSNVDVLAKVEWLFAADVILRKGPIEGVDQ